MKATRVSCKQEDMEYTKNKETCVNKPLTPNPLPTCKIQLPMWEDKICNTRVR